MGKPLRLLLVEDSEDDVLLMIRELKTSGYEPEYEYVKTGEAMRTALREKAWDVILCDYRLPKFNGQAAIALLKDTGIDIPLIIVSGTIGEETAVECMRLGASDYVMKGNLSRLVPAIKRELIEAESRSQRKRAEDALKESENRFREMFNDAPIGYHELDTEGRISRVNRTELAMLGYSTEEMLGRYVWEFIDQKEISRKAVLGKIAGTLPSGQNIEREYIKKDGTRMPVLIQDLLVREKNGKITGIRTTLQDITGRKRAEEDLRRTLDRLKKAVSTTIQVMVSAVEARDPYTAGHQLRSADLARAIAIEMGLPLENIEAIRMAGSIHDIGKLSIPAEILSKPTKLSENEFALIKEHACQGHKILKQVESSWPLAEMVYQHHERMDGSGYPRHLKGDDILMGARILAIADVVEAMASHRPYRPALGIDNALEEIEENRGVLYDPEAVNACLKLFREKAYHLA